MVFSYETESMWMGLGGHKKALFINYLPQCKKNSMVWNSCQSGEYFFAECFSETEFLLTINFFSLVKAKEDTVGIKKGREGEWNMTSKRGWQKTKRGGREGKATKNEWQRRREQRNTVRENQSLNNIMTKCDNPWETALQQSTTTFWNIKLLRI